MVGIEEAQGALLVKREELLKANTQLTSSEGSFFHGRIKRLQPLKQPQCTKCGAEDSGPVCVDCEIKSRDWKSRKQNTEKHLKAMGIGKRYLPCSFDNFRDGQKYTEFCRSWVSNPAESIFFTGYYGSGKTHLAVAICRELIVQERRWNIRFINAVELLYEIRRTFNSDEDCKYVIGRYSKADILVLDDLGAEKTTEWAIETLSLIIDRRDRELLPTIITSNLSLADIADKLSGRISSRMANGKIVKIGLPDYRKKR